MDDKKSSNSTAISTSITSVTPSLLDAWKPVITSLVTSKYSGVKDEGDGMLLLLKAHELGIGFGNAISHIHVINGRAGIDIHIIKAILSKPGTGVTWEKVYDFEPIYNVLLYTKVKTISTDLPDEAVQLAKLTDNPQVDVLVAKGKVPYVRIPDANGAYTPIDYITAYKFTRKKKDIDGEWIIVHEYREFKWSDAITAGLVTKDVWVKWGKDMLDHRAFTPPSRAIASDLLMGTYSYDELLTMNGYTPSEYDTDGNIIEIRNKNGDIVHPNNEG